MKWIDLHCDALNKRYRLKQHGFNDAGNYDVDIHKIIYSNVRVQTFAIYVSDYIQQNRVEHAKMQMKCFDNIVRDCGFTKIVSKIDLKHCLQVELNWGALLSLEGLDGMDQMENELEQFYQRGLRSLSLTWNHSNWAADGAYGTVHNGISKKGYNFIKKCEALKIRLDASHLSEKSFWDLIKFSTKPIYCSHSNTNFVQNHPRNLSDPQIRAIISQNGVIGLTFVPAFLSSNRPTTIEHLIKNIYHICELGGENCIAFGSDFDGIDEHVTNLTNTGEMMHFFRRLSEEFSHKEIENFTWKNAYSYLIDHL